MLKKINRYLLIFLTTLLLGCSSDSSVQNLECNQEYNVTIRVNQKDSTFVIHTTVATDKYMTELLVSDPECTECKDCYVNSGEIKIPEVLKPYVKWDKELFLTCKNPYEIERTHYVKYKLKGKVMGVKNGYLLFCVSEWERRE